MRKTRAQHDQFWDQLHYNVDEYVKQDARHQASPRKGSAELVRKLSQGDGAHSPMLAQPLGDGTLHLERQGSAASDARRPDPNQQPGMP